MKRILQVACAVSLFSCYDPYPKNDIDDCALVFDDATLLAACEDPPSEVYECFANYGDMRGECAHEVCACDKTYVFCEDVANDGAACCLNDVEHTKVMHGTCSHRFCILDGTCSAF